MLMMVMDKSSQTPHCTCVNNYTAYSSAQIMSTQKTVLHDTHTHIPNNPNKKEPTLKRSIVHLVSQPHTSVSPIQVTQDHVAYARAWRLRMPWRCHLRARNLTLYLDSLTQNTKKKTFHDHLSSCSTSTAVESTSIKVHELYWVLILCDIHWFDTNSFPSNLWPSWSSDLTNIIDQDPHPWRNQIHRSERWINKEPW